METKQLKILMTTDTVGGVWTYSLELCRALAPHGVQFFLVTMGEKLNDAQKQAISTLENVQVFETDYMLEWMKDPWKEIDESGQWLLRLEKVLCPDLVHLNCFSYGSLPFRAPVVVAGHSDVYSWFMSVTGEDPSHQWLEYFWRAKKGLEHADAVIAPSRAMGSYLTQIYSNRINCRVIYNSRSASLFRSAAREPYILSIGRIWDKAKNIALLARASSRIRYEIRIAGDQEFSGNCTPEELTGINCLGRLAEKEVAKQLSHASVYVMPAKYEPFGLSVLEAALSGCALVLGDIPSLREIWGEAALYTSTTDPVSLAATVNGLMSCPEELTYYAQKAAVRARMYAPEIMAGKYMQVYSSLVRSTQRKTKILL